MTVFQPEPVEETVFEPTSVEEYNRIVDEHQKKDGFFLIADQRRINGTVKVTEIEPIGSVPIDNDRRERVYEATNRILEHAPGAELHDGEGNNQFHKVEAAVDTILSTIGVPDRRTEE